MGKTVPSYRMALEFEIHRWKDFRNALPNEKEKEAFDELMDMCRNNGMAVGAKPDGFFWGLLIAVGFFFVIANSVF
jgi:hypothetical protein